jgi:hypothetical protein
VELAGSYGCPAHAEPVGKSLAVCLILKRPRFGVRLGSRERIASLGKRCGSSLVSENAPLKLDDSRQKMSFGNKKSEVEPIKIHMEGLLDFF